MAKTQLGKSLNIITTVILSAITTIGLIFGIIYLFMKINTENNYQYKATYTSVEYSLETKIYINIEKADERQTLKLENTDFVLYINGNPTPATGFIVNNTRYNTTDVDKNGIIIVYFNHTKSQIDQPINLYLKSKKLEINKSVKF